jgi:hypothetical protein
MNATGRLVYYSLAAVGGEACERQWIRSIHSLRRHSPWTPVALVLYGAPRAETLATARSFGVRVIYGGEYRRCFAHLPPRIAEVLLRNPTLHKVPSLRLCPTEGVGQVLFLDCDTYFFGDVDGLFQRYQAHHFYAREEPGSSRCPGGYDPAYVNEDALRRLSWSQGLAAIPPYNSGVFLLNGGAWEHLGALADEFLAFAWRLLVGLAAGSNPGAALDADLAALLARNVAPADWSWRLPFPSSNAWIVEEIAMWLTLGRIPGLTHDVLRTHDVAQDGEAVAAAQAARNGAPGPRLVHYFGGGEDDFFAEVG